MIHLNPTELKFSFIRAPGPGGQNVNKVASAVLLRFNVAQSVSLNEYAKSRIKTTRQGELIIKASRFRTQERNKQDAIERLQVILQRAAAIPKKRKKTKPTLGSKQRRLSEKKLHAKTKLLRTKQRLNHDG